MREGIHHESLQCFVVRLEYDWPAQEGRLFMESASCCDMLGCIELFKRIDPQVRKILTYAGDQLDTQYRRKADQRWISIDHHGVERGNL